MNSLYDLHDRPALVEPPLLIALDGWIDAGGAAANALGTMLEALDTRPIASFDTDALLDYRARRPTLELVEGVVHDLTWQRLELRHGLDLDGRDFLLLVGAEPDHAWKAFCEQVADLALDLDVRLVVGMGAYPAPTAHTRPVGLSCTAATPDLAGAHAFLRYTVDVPGGAQAAIERSCADAGIPACGLWAQVPHYVAGMPYPAASLILLEGVQSMTSLRLPFGDLAQQATEARDRIDGLVAGNPQHEAMVRALEQQTEGQQPPPMTATGNLPSGDELAAEFERFLRDQGDT